MAYETEQANIITIGNAIASMVTPAFVNGSQGYALVRKEPLPADSKVVTFPKLGYLTAETVAESTDYTYSANSELTDSSIQVTAKKSVVGAKTTVEAMRFAAWRANDSTMMTELGNAHARLFDADLKALFSSIATGVTATSTFNKNLVIDGRYNIVASLKQAFSGTLVAMVDFKAISEIHKELTDTAASAFVNSADLGILGMPNSTNGYAGKLLGVDFYQTDGLPLANGNTDDVGCMWDPNLCFGAAVDTQDGISNSMKDPSAINGISKEFLTWFFFKVAEINDVAGCRLISDT